MNIGSGSVAMCPVLSDIAGMTNYAGSELDLNYVPALTKQSLTNIVNTIGDVSTSESAHIFKVLATQQAMLTEAQIELLIDKG